MPSTIVTTAGGTGSNSYVSQAECTTYLGDRLNASAWTDATTAEKDQALIMAARRLNDEDYVGSPVEIDIDSRQALAWPRSGAYDRNGNWLDHESIPQIVKDAQCELALALLDADDDLLADTGLEAFQSVSVGSLSVTPIQGRTSGRLPAHVRRILAPVLTTQAGTVSLVRG